MTVITPRGGASLAQVVQAALNVAGSAGVSIVTGGGGNGVQLPDAYVAAVEEALGWTAAERGDPPTPTTTHQPTPPPTPVVEPVAPAPAAATPPPAPEPVAPAAKTPPKKTTSTPRRARRGKEG